MSHEKAPHPARDGTSEFLRTSHVQTTSDVRADVDVPEIVKTLDLSKADAAEFTSKLETARTWILSDPDRAKRFHENPLRTLREWNPEIGQKLPPSLRTVLDDAQPVSCTTAPTGAFNACAADLLQRVASWVAMSPGNRASFIRNPDIAVDAVAAASPIEARALVKAALQAARRTT